MLALLWASACGSTASQPPAAPASSSAPSGASAGAVGDTIVLGMYSTLTGPLAATGVPARDGVQTWVDEVNQAGGINGRKLKLIAYDDANSPQQAIADTRRLIDQDHVFALICGSSSGSTLATLDLIRSAKIPFVTCITADRGLFQPFSPYIYRIYANEVAQAEADIDYMAGTLHSKRPAIIYNSNDFGIHGYQTMQQRLSDRWQEKFVSAVSYNPGDQDFTSQLLQIKKENPDALLVHAFAAEAGIIVRQAKSLGLNVPMVGGGGTPTPLFPKAAGQDGVGFTAVWVFPVLPDAGVPAVDAYIGKLKQYVYPNGLPTGRPSLYDMTGYIAGQVMGEGLKRAGKDLTRDGLVKALDSLQNFDPAGLGFPINFSPTNHEGTSQVTLVRVDSDLKWQLFKP